MNHRRKDIFKRANPSQTKRSGKLKGWCRGAELNHRRKDFQSFALPLSYPGTPNLKILRPLEYTTLKKKAQGQLFGIILVSDAVSVNKLVQRASIATKENAETLAEQVKILSQRAIETLAQDERKFSENDVSTQDENGLQISFFRRKICACAKSRKSENFRFISTKNQKEHGTKCSIIMASTRANFCIFMVLSL